MELWGFEHRESLIGEGFGLLQNTTPPRQTIVTITPTAGTDRAARIRLVDLVQDGNALQPDIINIVDAARRDPEAGESGTIVPIGTQASISATEQVGTATRQVRARVTITGASTPSPTATPPPTPAPAPHVSAASEAPPPSPPSATTPPPPPPNGMTHEDAQNVTRALNESTQQASGMATAQAVAAIGGTVVGLANASVNAVAANRLGTASYGAGYGPVLGGGYSGAYGGGFGGIDLTGTNFSLGLFGGDEQGKMRRMNALLNELMAKIRSGNFNMDDLLPALTLVTLQSKMTLSKAAFYMIQTMRSKQEEMSRNTERLAHINNPQASTEFAQINVQNQQIMMDQQVVQQSVQSVMGMVEEFSNLLNVIRTKVDRIRQAEMPRA